MPRRPEILRTPRSLAAGLAVVAIVCVLMLYGRTVAYGFRYDDYHTVRPWSSAEVLQVLHGSWDPAHIEVDFYRPLSAWWFALRFALFGMNGSALHALSIAGMIVCAWMTGVFVWRESGHARAAFFAAGLYAIHPAFPYAQGVWLTNQMHLLSSLIVLGALLAWQRARAGTTRDWWPVFALQMIGAGLKEDTLMLLPLLIALTILRRLLIGDIRWPAWPTIAAAVGIPAALFGVRFEILGKLGGYGAPPALPQAWDNYTRGLMGIFRQIPARRPWQPTASIVSQTIVVAGGIASAFRRPQFCLFLSGLLIALVFDLPFALVSKAEQMHLVTLGAVLALTGGISGLIEIMPSRIPKLAMTMTTTAACVVFAPVTQNIVTDFKPCSAITLNTDVLATEWWVVPPEIRAWLLAKPAACKAGLLDPLPGALSTITWALGTEVDGRGDSFQWTSDHAVVLVNPRVIDVSLRVRAPMSSPGHSTTMIVRGITPNVVIDLATTDWQIVPIHMTRSRLGAIGGMQRLDLDVSPVFVPAAIDPASRDHRTLGAQIWITGR